MAHGKLAEDLKNIETIITEHPEGIGISALEKVLEQRSSQVFNRRTLQRRLARLVKDKRAVVEGESSAIVYKPVAQPTGIAPTIGIESPEVELYVPVSSEGSLIRDRVRQPLMYRRPVGYERDFLSSCEPGSTFYLPESLRIQLHEMGRTPAFERPAGAYAKDIFNRLLVDLSWASSKLEGNTYNRPDTRNLIEFGRVAQGKDAQETQMILNHKAAVVKR